MWPYVLFALNQGVCTVKSGPSKTQNLRNGHGCLKIKDSQLQDYGKNS